MIHHVHPKVLRFRDKRYCQIAQCIKFEIHGRLAVTRSMAAAAQRLGNKYVSCE